MSPVVSPVGEQLVAPEVVQAVTLVVGATPPETYSAVTTYCVTGEPLAFDALHDSDVVPTGAKKKLDHEIVAPGVTVVASRLTSTKICVTPAGAVQRFVYGVFRREA